MRHWIAAVVVLVCGSCSQLPSADVPFAPTDNARAVVFDIDGTLTPTPLKYRSVRRDAAGTVRHFADRGWEIVYLTARVGPLQSGIPDWLREHGFPEGGVYVTETAEDRADHARFKTRILRDFLAHGWKIEFAYGDSSSDFDAYAAAGIPKQRVFALRREGKEHCQPGVWNACLTGWTDYLHSLAD